MIKKKRKEEIDVKNINADVVKFYYTQDLKSDTCFYKPQPFVNEACTEEIDTNIEHLEVNLKRLVELRDTESMEIDPEDVNVCIIEYFMDKTENKKTVKRKIKTQKKARTKKKILNGEVLEHEQIMKNEQNQIMKDEQNQIMKDEQNQIMKDEQNQIMKDDVLDLLVNIATSTAFNNSNIIDDDSDNISNDNISNDNISNDNLSNDNTSNSDISLVKNEDTSHLTVLSTDKRLLYFLKKSNPSLLKMCDDVKEFIERNEIMMIEKGKLNYAAQDFTGKCIPLKKDICKIQNIKETYWTDTEKSKFKHLVLKYKNSFDKIQKVLPSKSIKEIILRYYCNKDKTFDYIKKKSGRISDSECNIFVNGTWTEIEKSLFNEKYPQYGKSLNKYQAILPKTLKELKIYLRWYQKNTVKIKPKSFLSDWSIDEKQIFAIYYPFFNKNWITMSGHFSTKNSKDLKMYYTKYFKNLSYNEQKFETYIKEYNLKSNTDPVLHNGDSESDWNDTVGWIFKAS